MRPQLHPPLRLPTQNAGRVCGGAPWSTSGRTPSSTGASLGPGRRAAHAPSYPRARARTHHAPFTLFQAAQPPCPAPRHAPCAAPRLQDVQLAKHKVGVRASCLCCPRRSAAAAGVSCLNASRHQPLARPPPAPPAAQPPPHGCRGAVRGRRSAARLAPAAARPACSPAAHARGALLRRAVSDGCLHARRCAGTAAARRQAFVSVRGLRMRPLAAPTCPFGRHSSSRKRQARTTLPCCSLRAAAAAHTIGGVPHRGRVLADHRPRLDAADRARAPRAV